MHRAGWQWLLAVCALWVAGCTCGKPPVESELTVGFERPVDGQRLALGEDADPATAGFQYEVVAVAADSAGRTVTLSGAKLEVKQASETEWSEGPAAVLEGQRVRFSGVTLPGRTLVLRVTVEEQGSKRTATNNQSVTVGAETSSVDIIGPAEGQVLRESDDVDPAPGYQVRFRLRTSGLAGRQGTLVCEKACGLAPTDFVVSPGGTTEVPVTLAQAACEAQAAECYAVVKFGGRDVTSPRRGLLLDTVAPRVEVSAPVAPRASTTFKVEAAVGCCEDGAVATLSREGGEVFSAPVGTGGVSFPAVSVPRDGTYAFTLSVTDSGGNVSRRPLSVVVANTAPGLTLDAPASVGNDQDGVSANGVQASVRALVTGVAEGTPVEFWQSVNGRLGEPMRVASRREDGRLVAEFDANLAEGENTLRACVRNTAGLESCALKTVMVATGRKTCRIMTPRDHAVRGGASNPLAVTVEAESGPVTVRAFRPGGASAVAEVEGAVSGGITSVSVPFTQDGDHVLIAQCPGGVSQALAFRLDTQAPTLSATVRGTPDDTSPVDGSLADTSLLPGMQVTVEARTEPEATVSVTGCELGAAVTAKAGDSGTALLREVSVPRSGTCELSLTATDVAGNVTTLKRTLTLALDAVSLEFASPLAGSVLGRTSGTVQAGGGLAVPVRVSLPGRAGKLRLLGGSTVLSEVDVTSDEMAHTFENVLLTEGANVLRAELVGAGGAITCITGLFVVNTAELTVALTAPASASGSVKYNVDNDLQQDVPGIQRPLSYSVTTTAAQYTVDICTDVPLLPAATLCRDGQGYTLVSNAPPNTALFTYPEGRYALYAVLDDGHLVLSAPVAMTVDAQRPRVVSVQLDNDSDGNRILTAKDLPTGAPAVQVTTVDLENDSVVQVINPVSRAVLGTSQVRDNTARVVLTALATAEDVTLELAVRVVDQAGNTNNLAAARPLDPRNEAAFFSFRMDRKPPDLRILAPGRLSLGPADDADPTTPGFQLGVSVDTSADVGPEGLEIVATPSAPTVSRSRVGSTLTQVFTVSSGSTRFDVSATDLLGNGRSTSLVVSVDLTPPTLSFTRPTGGSTHIGSLMAVELSVEGEEGREVSLYSQPMTEPPTSGQRTKVGAATVTRLMEGGLVARTDVSLSPGTYRLIAELTDVAGNLGKTLVEDVTVDAPGCDLRFVDPSASPMRFVARDDQDTTRPGLQYTLVGEALDCKGLGVSLFRDEATPAVATRIVDAMGRVSFPVELADGESARFRMEMKDSLGNTTADLLDASADLTPPTLVVSQPRKDSAGKLFVVAASENVNVLKAVSGYVADLRPNESGGQVQLLFDVAGAQNGLVRFLYNGTEVSPAVTPSTDPATIDRLVTLPHGSAGTLELRVSDAAGNQVSYEAQVSVDVVAPGTVAVRRTLPPESIRTALVQVQWDPVGDDGVSGVVTGYDLRWATNAQLPDVAGVPAVIADDAQFHDTVRVRQETGKTLASNTLSYALKLPPLASYSIQVRALDEVGNYSAFQKEPAALVNFWRRATLGNPAGSGAANGFAKYMASGGDLNADGKDELVVGASDLQPGAVYVHYGASDPSAAARQELTPPDTSTQSYGVDFSLGNVGDEAAEGAADLVVGARRWTGGGTLERGRAFLYVGRKEQQLDRFHYFELQGPSGVAASFGASTRIINDLNGDGLKELVISAYGELKTYLFFGRSVADWRLLGKDPVTNAACTASTVACVIPASAADVKFTAPTGTPFFGMYRGNTTLGDLNGDGLPEMCVVASRQDTNKVWIYSGHRLTKDATLTTATTDILQLLENLPTDPGTGLTGFGTEAVGGFNLFRGAGFDFVVANPFKQLVYIYPDGGPSGFTTAPLKIGGGLRFGTGLRVADFNGDGLLDLLIGQNQASNNSAFIFYQRAVVGAEFDASGGIGFSQSRLTSSTALGLTVASGDFNGDGLPDVAAGDSQSTPAKVEVWY